MNQQNNIETVDYVDLEKYLGDWYEIARYKNNFQTECLGTKANYSLNWADISGFAIPVSLKIKQIRLVMH